VKCRSLPELPGDRDSSLPLDQDSSSLTWSNRWPTLESELLLNRAARPQQCEQFGDTLIHAQPVGAELQVGSGWNVVGC
jgi:hypothetical protein